MSYLHLKLSVLTLYFLVFYKLPKRQSFITTSSSHSPFFLYFFLKSKLPPHLIWSSKCHQLYPNYHTQSILVRSYVMWSLLHVKLFHCHVEILYPLTFTTYSLPLSFCLLCVPITHISLSVFISSTSTHVWLNRQSICLR